MVMLVIFAAIALTAIGIERLYPARPQPFFRTGFFTDTLHTVINILLRASLSGFLAISVTELGRQFLPPGLFGVLTNQPVWFQFLAVVLVLDFIFYWTHRAKHRFQWWWRLHETHHSSEDLDWFSSVRFHPLEKILDRLIYLLPLAFLGASDTALLALATLDATIASLAHSNSQIRLGPLIYLFVGPEMHAWHHSADPDRQRRNFGNNLSVFDWIFGTAELRHGRPDHFGTADPHYPQESWLRQVLYSFRREKR